MDPVYRYQSSLRRAWIITNLIWIPSVFIPFFILFISLFLWPSDLVLPNAFTWYFYLLISLIMIAFSLYLLYSLITFVKSYKDLLIYNSSMQLPQKEEGWFDSYFYETIPFQNISTIVFWTPIGEKEYHGRTIDIINKYESTNIPSYLKDEIFIPSDEYLNNFISKLHLYDEKNKTQHEVTAGSYQDGYSATRNIIFSILEYHNIRFINESKVRHSDMNNRKGISESRNIILATQQKTDKATNQLLCSLCAIFLSMIPIIYLLNSIDYSYNFNLFMVIIIAITSATYILFDIHTSNLNKKLTSYYENIENLERRIKVNYPLPSEPHK